MVNDVQADYQSMINEVFPFLHRYIGGWNIFSMKVWYDSVARESNKPNNGYTSTISTGSPPLGTTHSATDQSYDSVEHRVLTTSLQSSGHCSGYKIAIWALGHQLSWQLQCLALTWLPFVIFFASFEQAKSKRKLSGKISSHWWVLHACVSAHCAVPSLPGTPRTHRHTLPFFPGPCCAHMHTPGPSLGLPALTCMNRHALLPCTSLQLHAPVLTAIPLPQLTLPWIYWDSNWDCWIGAAKQ